MRNVTSLNAGYTVYDVHICPHSISSTYMYIVHYIVLLVVNVLIPVQSPLSCPPYTSAYNPSFCPSSRPFPPIVQLFSSCCCNYTVSFLLFSFYNLILILILPFSVANYHKQSNTLFFISSQSYSLFPLLQSSHFLSLTILHRLILSFLHSSKQFSVQTYPYPLAFFYTANLLILLLFHCY